METSSLFCTPEHSSHDWSSLFQLTPKQCGGRPHVIPNQLNTAPALCTLHPHSVGDAFLCGGAEEWNFSCIEHEIKKEEARTSDNTLCEAAVSDLELTLLSLTATICSSSSPSASPHHCSTLSCLFFFFLSFSWHPYSMLHPPLHKAEFSKTPSNVSWSLLKWTSPKHHHPSKLLPLSLGMLELQLSYHNHSALPGARTSHVLQNLSLPLIIIQPV